MRLLILLAMLCACAQLSAATLTVTNLNDSGAGSLRQACADAASGDSVVFQAALAGTITFGSEIDLGAKALTITGNADVSGAPAITLDGNQATRHFSTTASLSVSLLVCYRGRVTGFSTGGAIYSTSTVNCANCVFSENLASQGGAVYCQVGVTCTDCTFFANLALYNGGAIKVDSATISGIATCTGCTFSGNNLGIFGVRGGAIDIRGSITCTACTFDTNYIDSSGRGGAIYGSGNVTCTGCTFNGNFLTAFVVSTGGGAIYSEQGVNCTGCTFSSNYTFRTGGAIGADMGVTCTDCTFLSNSAQEGRCIFCVQPVTITNCILADSSVSATTPMVAGGGTFTSGGYNICTDPLAELPWMNTATDQMNTDPMLGPLQDNGGPVQTMRPLTGSPAIDKGGGSTTTVDARGVARPNNNPGISNASGGDGRDIGAVEFEFNSAPVITAPASLIIAQNMAHTFSATLSIADNALAGDELQLTLTATQGSVTLAQITGLTFSTGDGTADANMDFTGTLTNINAALNGAQFIPATGYLGAAGLQIDIDDQGNAGDDGALTDSESVSIDVQALNQAPVITAPTTANTPSGTPLAFTSISIADADAASGLLEVSLTATNGALTLAATTGLTFSAGDGTADAVMTFTGSLTNINGALSGATFTPTLAFIGAASVQIDVDDQGNTGPGGAMTDSETVAITVQALNQAPVITAPTTANTPPDTPLAFTNISIADADAASGLLEVSLTATNGALTLAATTGLTFSAGDGTADAAMTFTGTLTNINAALSGATFTPTLAFIGAASLQIDVDDQGNTGPGGVMTDTHTINITVATPGSGGSGGSGSGSGGDDPGCSTATAPGFFLALVLGLLPILVWRRTRKA